METGHLYFADSSPRHSQKVESEQKRWMGGSEGWVGGGKDDEDTEMNLRGRNESTGWPERFELELCDTRHARPRDETIKANAWTHQWRTDGCYGLIHQRN